MVTKEEQDAWRKTVEMLKQNGLNWLKLFGAREQIGESMQGRAHREALSSFRVARRVVEIFGDVCDSDSEDIGLVHELIDLISEIDKPRTKPILKIVIG
jgi:hypothetical protein